MQLLCGQCGQVQTVDDDDAADVECPHCGHSIVIPGEFDPSATVTAAESPLDEEEGFAEVARQAVPRTVRLTCHECDKRFSVSARRSGRQGRCPACGTRIDVPYPDDELTFDLPHVPHAGIDHDEAPVELVAIEDAMPDSSQRADEALVLPRTPVHHRKPTRAEQAAALAAAAEAAAPAPPPKKAVAERPPKPATKTVQADRSAEAVATIEAVDEKQQPASSKRMYVLLAAGVALAVAAGVGLHFLPAEDADDGNGGSRIAGNTGGNKQNNGGKTNANGGKTNGNGGKTNGNGGKTNGNGGNRKPPNGGKGNGPANGHKTLPPNKTGCNVTSASLDVFANGGYFPAPPGMMYLKAKVFINAGAEAVDFQANKRDVRVSFAQGEAPTLGLAAPPGLVPAPALPGQGEHLDPGQSCTRTFLFLVPADLSSATLAIRNVGSAKVPPIDRPPTPDVGDLAGTFVETQPRNLRPLMEDPVIAAVQGARGQRLYVHRRDDTLQVYITPGSVRGVAKPIGQGVYETTLKHGRDEKACMLRLAEGGEKLIVYFSHKPADFAHKPFHQMTYARVKR